MMTSYATVLVDVVVLVLTRPFVVTEDDEELKGGILLIVQW